MSMKLTRYVINDLFGYQTVDIPFDGNIKILIGENGIGKTTVLNTLFFILSKKFDRLNKINFSSIELHSDKRKIVIRKDELQYYLDRPKIQGRSHFSEILSKATKEQLAILKKIIETPASQTQRFEVVRVLRDELKMNINAPSNFIYDTVRRFIFEQEGNSFLKTIGDLDSLGDFKILYFPTYRRIEEELKVIGFVPRKEIIEKYGHFFDEEEVDDLNKKTFEEDIIQFGMSDVEERIKNVTSEITKSSIIGFSEITGEMLHQLLTNFPEARATKGAKVEIDKLQIILERVGPNITVEDKQKIIQMMKSGKTGNPGLIYFINKLIALYNNQEILDMSIKRFVETCNAYLKNKKYIYDEREVSLKIIRDQSTDEVKLNQLSSGEKQIVSLFSKIYLEQTSNYVVLFDEPELSLSIYWQQRLLPDINKSGKCSFLFAVTHSPFIYDNELQSNTSGLSEFTRISGNESKRTTRGK